MDSNAYRNTQGNGYATVLKPFGLETLAASNAAKQRAASERDASLNKQIMESKPEEVWHYYSAGVNKMWDDWLVEGAKMMTSSGIENAWKSTDPRAIQWQINGAKIKAAAENSKQAQTAYEKAMQDIAVRGNDYTDEYKEKVKNFPTTELEKIATGQFDFPQAEFKNPASVTTKLFVGRKEAMMKGRPEGYVPSQDEIKTELANFMSLPENDPEVRSFKQSYDSLTQEGRDYYQSQAELSGFSQGWQGLALDQFSSQFKMNPVNLAEEANKLAATANMKASEKSTEDSSGVTQSSSAVTLADKKYPDKVAKSYFTAKPYLLNDAATMAQLGISMDVPFEKRQALAEAAFANNIRKGVETKFSSGLSRATQGASEKEIKGSYDKWRTDIGMGNIQAAQFTFKTKTPWGTVDVATIAQDTPTPFKYRKALILNFADKQEAESFREKIVSSNPDANEIIRFYKEKDDLSVAVPIANEYEQVLKQIHTEAVKQQGGLYERVGKYDFPNVGTPSATTIPGQESAKNVERSRLGEFVSKFPFMGTRK